MAINLKLGDRLAIIKDGVKKGYTPQEAMLQYQINKDGGYNNWKNQFKLTTGVNPDLDDTYNYELFFKENPEAAKLLLLGKVSPEILQMYKTPQAIQKEKQVLLQRQRGNINSLMDYSLYEKLINDYMNKSVSTPMYAVGGPISINMYANGTSELATSDNPNVTEIGMIPEKWSRSIAPDFIEVTPEELQYFKRATMNVPDAVYSDESVPLEYKDVASKHTKWISVPWDYIEERSPNSRRSKGSTHATYYMLEDVDEDNPKKYYRLYRVRESSPEGRAYDYWKRQQAYEDRQSREYEYNYGDGEWLNIGTSEVLPLVTVTYNPETKNYVEEPKEEIITSENTSKPIADSIPVSETSPYAQGNSETSYYNPFNAPDGELNVPNNNPYGTEGVSGGSSFGSGTEGIRMPDVFDMNSNLLFEDLQWPNYLWEQEDLEYLNPPGYVPIPNWDVALIYDTDVEGVDFADFMMKLAGYGSRNNTRDLLMQQLMLPKDYFADPYAGNNYNDARSFYDAYNNDPFTKIQRESNGIPLYVNGGRINKFEVGGEPSIEELALQRALLAISPKSNYHKAIDFVYGPVSAMKMAYDKGVSNCTLTASQFYNPKKPIARAKTITTTPHVAGFYEVGENYAIPGSMVITSLPNGNDYGKNSYHTMILNGYADKNYQFPFKGKVYNVKKGDPLVNYSKGKREPENYIKNIPLSAYLDNSDGKTNVRYYRPYNEGLRAKLLPEIIVTPTGNSIVGRGASSTWANGGLINKFEPGGFVYIPDNQLNLVVDPFEFEGIRYGWLPNGGAGEDVYSEHNDRNGVYVRWDNDNNKWAKTTVPRDLGNIKNYFTNRHNELATYDNNAPAANAYDPYNNPAISAQLNNLFNNDPVIKELKRRLFDAKLKEYNPGNFLSTIIPMHLLSPTNYVGAIGEAAREGANFFLNALSGHNRGLFSLSNNLYDWASEHPYLSAGVNMLGDVALGAVAAKPFIDWKNPDSLLSLNIRTSFANDKIPFSYVLKDSENVLPYFRGTWATLKGERIPLLNRLQKAINRSNHVAYENAPLALPNETYQQYLKRTELPYSSMVESFYNRLGMWNQYQGVGDEAHNLNMSVHGRSENYIKQPDGTYDINLTKEEEANFLTPKDKVNDDFSYVTYDYDIGNHGNVGALLAYKNGKLVSILTDPFDLHPAEAIIRRLPEGLIRKVGKVIIPNPEASAFLPKGTNIPVFKHTIPIEEQGFIGYNWDTQDIVRPTLRVDAKDLMNNGSFLTIDTLDIVRTFRPGFRP